MYAGPVNGLTLLVAASVASGRVDQVHQRDGHGRDRRNCREPRGGQGRRSQPPNRVSSQRDRKLDHALHFVFVLIESLDPVERALIATPTVLTSAC
jgi:hypothetical protein